MNTTSRILFGTFTAGAIAAAIALGASSSCPATAAPAPAAEAAPSGAFKIDGVHSSIVFKVKHLNTSNFYGVFKDASGTFSLGDKASMNVTVKADSVDTRNAKRDQHVASPDFFSAKEFPTITFVAKDLAKSGEGMWKGTGDLTFRGVTKPVSITLNETGSGPGMDGKTPLVGLETTFTIKRSDFGNKFMADKLGDEVTLIVALEGSQTSEAK